MSRIDELFAAAIEIDDVKSVESLLEKGASVDHELKGRTALTFAIERGCFKVAKLLIEKGADVDLADETGRNALIYATVPIVDGDALGANLKNSIESVMERLGDVKNSNTIPVISLIGLHDIVKLVIEKSNNLNVNTGAGWTPLMLVSQRGEFEIAKLMLEKGADANLKTQHGYRALDVAIEKEHQALAKLLLSHTDLSVYESLMTNSKIFLLESAKHAEKYVTELFSKDASTIIVCNSDDFECLGKIADISNDDISG